MTRKLIVGPFARADLLSHTAWLSQPGAGDKARRQIRAIQTAIEALKVDPALWPRSPDHPDYRERIVGRYVLLYRVDPDTGRREDAGDVYVVRIFGPGQDRTASPPN